MLQEYERTPEAAYYVIPPHKRIYDVVSIIAYLIGVRQAMFERDYLVPEIYERLQETPSARRIRCLSEIRTALLTRHEEISYHMMYNIKNLDTLPDYINTDSIAFLEENGVSLLHPNYRPDAYIADINRYMGQYINECADLIPGWLHWDYVRELFIMPDGSKETGIRAARSKFKTNINNYPFHCYLNWTLGDNGNILHHDAKFVSLLYASHKQQFTDLNKVIGAGYRTKEGLYEFVTSHKNIAIIVDCENSDPYRFCAVLRNIQSNCKQSAGNISRIILYDDIHSATAWQVLNLYFDVPVEHIMMKRVKDDKSLVDIGMTAGVCRAFYQHNIDSFILATSDSDYWGLISALPNANFHLLLEHEKCGGSLREALETAKIPYSFMDNFCQGNIHDIKVGALLAQARPYLDSSIHLNIKSMLASLYERTRINMTTAEKEAFYNRYIKAMKLNIDANGDVSIDIG